MWLGPAATPHASLLPCEVPYVIPDSTLLQTLLQSGMLSQGGQQRQDKLREGEEEKCEAEEHGRPCGWDLEDLRVYSDYTGLRPAQGFPRRSYAGPLDCTSQHRDSWEETRGEGWISGQHKERAEELSQRFLSKITAHDSKVWV